MKLSVSLFSAILACAVQAALLPAQARVLLQVGEQPPIFSSSGGIVDKVVVASLKAAGYEVELEWLPIGRMLALLKEDDLDRYITATNTPGQQHPNITFLEANGVFFYKKARFPGFRPKGLQDFKGYRVATVINSPNTALFEKAGMVVDECPAETMFPKLDLERDDFVATSDVGGILFLSKLFPGRESEFGFTEFSYSSIGAGLYARDDPELLAAARGGFEKIKANGELIRMLKSFFGAEHWQRVRIR